MDRELFFSFSIIYKGRTWTISNGEVHGNQERWDVINEEMHGNQERWDVSNEEMYGNQEKWDVSNEVMHGNQEKKEALNGDNTMSGSLRLLFNTLYSFAEKYPFSDTSHIQSTRIPNPFPANRRYGDSQASRK